MSTFPVHGLESAPEAARPALQAAARSLGFVPNLYGVLASSPPALEAYATLSKLVGNSSLSPVEQQVVLIAASVENGCDYCVAAHSVIASMIEAPREVVERLRAAQPPSDPKLAALARFTRAIVRQRGRVAPVEIERFRAAGYGERAVLEVILGVAMKTLSNYASHVAAPELDAAFEPQRWEAAA